MPFFRCFKRELFDNPFEADDPSTVIVSEPSVAYNTDREEEERISALVHLTQQVYLTVERELKLTGFWESYPARNKLKAEIQKVLLSQRFSGLPNIVKNREHIISRIMEIAENRNDIILYAE